MPDVATESRQESTVSYAIARSNVEETATFWGESLLKLSSPKESVRKELQTVDHTSRLHLKPHNLTDTPSPDEATADYELLHKLGEGGMGVVYAARQTSMDREVALKLMQDKTLHCADHRSRFLAEASVTGDLDHPNIVPVHDLGTNDRGDPFYVMKKVSGTPWDEAFLGLPLKSNLEILLDVMDAMAFAHARHVIHMDLKPENVMIGQFGEVLVMDWGLASAVHQPGKALLITDTDLIGGTPAYMSPEMAMGLIDRIGIGSDIYLLGAILFELLTGHPPHDGSDASACLAAAACNEIRPTEVEGELMEIARKAMASEPDQRYPSVPAMQTAIRNYLDHASSISLAKEAEKDLQTAKAEKRYQLFAQAIFGFKEALRLWEENPGARGGLKGATLAYAETAYQKGDFDLASELLDPQDHTHALLAKEVQRASVRRRLRHGRVRKLKVTVVALTVALVAALGMGLWKVLAEKERAEQAESNLQAALEQQQALQEALLRIEKEQKPRGNSFRIWRVALWRMELARAAELNPSLTNRIADLETWIAAVRTALASAAPQSLSLQSGGSVQGLVHMEPEGLLVVTMPDRQPLRLSPFALAPQEIERLSRRAGLEPLPVVELQTLLLGSDEQ